MIWKRLKGGTVSVLPAPAGAAALPLTGFSPPDPENRIKPKLLFILGQTPRNASCLTLKISTCTVGKGGYMFAILVTTVNRIKNALAAWFLSPNQSPDADENHQSLQTNQFAHPR